MSHDDRSVSTRLIATGVHGRYLLRRPRAGAPRRWLLGFHGYAQNAETMLELLRAVPGTEDWLVVSVQALHPFYGRANEVVANWMTRQDRELAIADNLAYVDAVVDTLVGEFGAPDALVAAGFSQGVAMAYRSGVLGRRPADAILAVAGDLPPELRDGASRRWPRVRVVVGSRDAFYPAETLARDVGLLRTAGADVSTHVFDGGHEWAPPVLAAAGELLATFR